MHDTYATFAAEANRGAQSHEDFVRRRTLTLGLISPEEERVVTYERVLQIYRRSFKRGRALL